jgi:hypothetical protein
METVPDKRRMARHPTEECGMNRNSTQLRIHAALIGAVLTTSSALADTRLVPEEYPTIQAAINASFDGDEVSVGDGTWTGDGNRDLDFGGRTITVRGRNGAVACTIDIQGSAEEPHRAFHFHSGETSASVVEGFTIRNGWMDLGGAMLIENGSAPTIEDCNFEENTSNPTIEDTGGGAAAIYDSQPTFDRCEFVGNRVNAIARTGGGALNITGGTVLITECNFADNSAVSVPDESTGGGAIIMAFGASVTVAGSTFTGNTSTFIGGAIMCALSAQLELTGCEIEYNSAEAGGGGVYLQDGHATMTDCGFTGNTSGQNWGGGGLRVLDATAEVVNCGFLNNTSLPGIGGGAWVAGAAQATFTDTLFIRNESDFGAGALGSGYGAATTAINCQFRANTAARGGAVWVGEESAHADIVNSTFALNQASNGGAIYADTGGDATVANSILWDDTPTEIALSGDGTASVTYSDIQGGWGGDGNIDADPMFRISCNCNFGNFRLSSSSPCIDAGDNTAVPEGIVTDLDGTPRFVDDPDTPDTGHGDPPIVDMGAYELQASQIPCPADLTGDDEVSVFDLLQLLGAWGPCADCPEDLDGNGTVDVFDLLELLGSWGGCN